MTALRKNVFEELKRIPEEKLTLLLVYMREIQNMPCKRKPGIAKGQFVCPESIDEDNELIEKWFKESI